MTTFIKKHWIDSVGAFGVFCAAALIKIELISSSDIFWWIIVIFFLALFISGIYEITIKNGIKNGDRITTIILTTICVWILPLLAGYAFAIYLIKWAISESLKQLKVNRII
jgi:hypothetical protein